MQRLATAKLGAYAALATGGFLAALLFGRPEAAALALPFALLALLALASVREPRVDVSAALDRDRVLEGEAVELTLTLTAEAPAAGLEVLVPGWAGGRTPPARLVVDLEAGETQTHAVALPA